MRKDVGAKKMEEGGRDAGREEEEEVECDVDISGVSIATGCLAA